MFPQLIETVRIVCGIAFIGGIIMTRFMDIEKVQPFFKQHKVLAFAFAGTACIGGLSFLLALLGI